jgi:hypothetical protein
LGPPLDACGNPTISVVNANNGLTLDFLSAYFDELTGKINISLPDKTKVTKGDYTL